MFDFHYYMLLVSLFDVVQNQDYLSELKGREFHMNLNYQLPPVEIPKPELWSRQQKSEKLQNIELPKIENTSRPLLFEVALHMSVQEGLAAMRTFYGDFELKLIKNGQVLQSNHPAALLSKFSASQEDTTTREMAAFAMLSAAKAFRKNYDVGIDFARQAHNPKISLRRTALEALCPPRDAPVCLPASERYRTYDGTCNNKQRPRLGAAFMPFHRFLPPEYGDGVDSIRTAVDGGPLASARFVSLIVHGAREGEAQLTLMLAQWGQLLDHDITSTAQPRLLNGSVPSCCGGRDFHPFCFPIKVPLDDPWLAPLNIRCLEFLRSAPAQRRDCVLSWREQINQATSFIDASPIYSSGLHTAETSRLFRSGLLFYGSEETEGGVCERGAVAPHCIRSGDGRSSEQPGLLALHHVWVGEHNHIAIKLGELNTHWNDEKIYQETRRIVGALFQHITFKEFLPIVLGREVMKVFDLELLPSGYYDGYDPDINPSVTNAFSAAAFRFGHSLVQGSYMRCDRFHNMINNNVSLHEEFQRGDIGSMGSLHRLLRGLANQRVLRRDEFITPELTNHLFQTPGFPFGLDLAAINIQRGRDHGLPSYTRWRVPCGLSPVTDWVDFVNVVGPESARRISHAYRSVHDIDLFVGGIAERPVLGGLVGPTFACIIAQQFSNTRKGDRFWYENSGFKNSFTSSQLQSIRQVSLAQVICRAVNGGTLQQHIFLPPDENKNKRILCGMSPLGEIDLNPWRERVLVPIKTSTQASTFGQSSTQDQFLNHVFNIIQGDVKKKAPTPIKIISVNKVGFSNREPITTTHNKTPINQGVQHNEEALKNPMSMTRAPQNNVTKINDKLDLRRETIVIGQHIQNQKLIAGVNGKLNQEETILNDSIRQNTTKRKMVVNNTHIELKNIVYDDKTLEKPKTKTWNEHNVTHTSKNKSKNIAQEGRDNLTSKFLMTKDQTKNFILNMHKSYCNENKTLPYIDEESIKAWSVATIILQNPTNNPGDSNVKGASQNSEAQTTNLEKLSNKMTSTEEVTDGRSVSKNAWWGIESKESLENNGRDESVNEKEKENNYSARLSKVEEILSKFTQSTKNVAFSKNNGSLLKVSEPAVLYIPLNIHTLRSSLDSFKNETINITDPEQTHTTPGSPINTLTDQQLSQPSNVLSIENKDHESYSNLSQYHASIKRLENSTETLQLNEIYKDLNTHIFKQICAKLKINHTVPQQNCDTNIDPLSHYYILQEACKRVARNLSPIKALAKVTKISATGNPVFISTTLKTDGKMFRTTPTAADNFNGRTKQYPFRPEFDYPSPHKIIVNGDNQFEIEINIKNKHAPSQEFIPYKKHTTIGYQTTKHQNFQTTPNYQNFHQTSHTPVGQSNPATKPPTIIIINENHITMQRPDFIENTAGWSTQSNSQSPYQEIISSPYSVIPTTAAYPMNSAYTPISTAASFSQSPVGGGLTQVQSSSTATTQGNYGSITSFVSTNGAQSTFSFNIRPDKTQIVKPTNNQNDFYSWQSQQPVIVNAPYSKREEVSNFNTPSRDNTPSPFSTSNTFTRYDKRNIIKRPTPQLKEINNNPPNQKLSEINYDYGERRLLSFKNRTDSEDFIEEHSREDYSFDAKMPRSPLLRLTDQDYSKPQESPISVLERNTSTLKNTHLNDNYVIPVLKDQYSKGVKQSQLNSSEAFGRNLNNSILALDENAQENPYVTFNSKPLNENTIQNLKLYNWMKYNLYKDQETLPEDMEFSVELPKPIQKSHFSSFSFQNVNYKADALYQESNYTTNDTISDLLEYQAAENATMRVDG